MSPRDPGQNRDRGAAPRAGDSGRPPAPAGPGRQFHVPAPSAGGSRTASSSAAGSSSTGSAGAGAGAGTPGAGTATRSRVAEPAAPTPPRRPPPAEPAPATSPPSPGRPRRAGRSRRRWLLAIPALLLAILLGALAWGWWTWSRIETVDLDDVLDPVTGDSVNYLLVGSDSRDELDPEGDSGVTGRRSDTIILLQTGPDGAAMMSVPRDLWVTIADTGQEGRINGAYNSGPGNLVRTVQENLDVPVNHYVEVGFASFVGLVDAMGGVTLEVPHPAVDRASGLVIPDAGAVRLDGQQALAYARSRQYTELIDGREVLEPTADLGRQQRQQTFLRTVLSDVGSTRNPVTLVRVADAMSSELVIDSGMGFFDALGLVRKLGGSDPETVVLPVEGVRRGQAAVLVTVEPDAQAVLDRFR